MSSERSPSFRCYHLSVLLKSEQHQAGDLIPLETDVLRGLWEATLWLSRAALNIKAALSASLHFLKRTLCDLEAKNKIKFCNEGAYLVVYAVYAKRNNATP